MAAAGRARYDLVVEDRFAIDDLAGHDLPDGTIVARNRRSGAQMPLPGEVFNAISYCDAFRTMDGHIAHLAGPNARGREEEIRQILQSVIDGGLMLSAAAICSRLEPRAGEPAPRSAVGAVITCERPDALARLLASMQEHCDPERLERIVVIDDSRSETSLSANRDAIETARAGFESRGFSAPEHFSPQDTSALTTALADRLPEHADAVRFLLDRTGREGEVTTGIARNLAQLHAVGRPLVVFDDDVVCTVLEPPERTAGVEFSSTQRGCRFYASDADWPRADDDQRQCPVGRHLQALGLSLAGSLAALGQSRPEPDAFEHAKPGFARRLAPDGEVLISQCGGYGDPGSGGNEWVALLPPGARAELAAIAGDIETTDQLRNCWLGRSRPVFEPHANMSQLTGFDNRSYLPPYFPLFRGQDRAFGAMTEFLHPRGLAVDLPFALPHLPIPPRSWGEFHRGFSLPFTLAHFLTEYVTGQVGSCGARKVVNRNQWLAMLYADLADSPDDRIIELTAAHWTQQRIDWLSKLAEALNAPGAQPPPLNDYLRKLMQKLQASAIRDFNTVEFKGSPDHLRGEDNLAWWRSAWRDFGAGLRAWPEIRTTAREILSG